MAKTRTQNSVRWTRTGVKKGELNNNNESDKQANRHWSHNDRVFPVYVLCCVLLSLSYFCPFPFYLSFRPLSERHARFGGYRFCIRDLFHGSNFRTIQLYARFFIAGLFEAMMDWCVCLFRFVLILIRLNMILIEIVDQLYYNLFWLTLSVNIFIIIHINFRNFLNIFWIRLYFFFYVFVYSQPFLI